MEDSTLFQFLAYYPWACVVLGIFAVIVCGISFTGTMINLYQTLLRHGRFRFYYGAQFILAGLVSCRYYELFTDKDSTLPLILADQSQAAVTMAFSVILPAVVLMASGFILSKISPKESPLLENWIFKEKLEKLWSDWQKKTSPKSSGKVFRKDNQLLALVIADEKATCQLVKRCLEKEQFKVIQAENGDEGLSLAALNYPELILLDLGLKHMDGLKILLQLREWTQTPVIILANGLNEDEELERPNNGHDYYLAKPFEASELSSLISTVLRHIHQNSQRKDESVFKTSIFQLHRGTRSLTVRKKEVHLTPHEYHILSFLVSHAGRVVTQRMINHEFWGKNIDEDRLSRYIQQLRNKIEYDPMTPKYILTEPGDGYRLKNR